MTEQAIEAAALPIVETAAKALAPEAEAALRELEQFAANEVFALDRRFPELLETAKTDADRALATAAGHVERIANEIRAKLGLGPLLSPGGTTAADPSPAAPTPQP